jgi:Na+-transporting NADH:ubiquinone oxidoreductase subunit NqrA
MASALRERHGVYLRGTSGAKREEVTGRWGKLNNDKYTLCRTLLGQSNEKRMDEIAGTYNTHGETRNTCKY